MAIIVGKGTYFGDNVQEDQRAVSSTYAKRVHLALQQHVAHVILM